MKRLIIGFGDDGKKIVDREKLRLYNILQGVALQR